MPDQVRASFAVFLVLIIMFITIYVGDLEDAQGDEPVVEGPTYSEIQHSAMMTDTDLDWGITLKASDVTRTGLTLTCEQSGGTIKGELSSGSQFSLDKLDGAKWVVVDTVIPADEVAWTQELYLIQEGGSVEWDVDWSSLYGEVPAGNYRISKTIFDDPEGTPDFDMNTYFAYFTVE